MPDPVHLLTLCGSLRAGSWNRRVLDTVVGLLPADWEVEAGTLADLPLYDQDLEDAGGDDAVRHLWDRAGAADAVLFAGPQYNHGISGVLKNGIDWLSRPPFSGPLLETPVAVLAVTIGRHVPVESVGQAETSLEMCAARVHRPGLAVASVRHRLDDSGEGFDAELTAELAAFAAAFAAFATTPAVEG